MDIMWNASRPLVATALVVGATFAGGGAELSQEAPDDRSHGERPTDAPATPCPDLEERLAGVDAVLARRPEDATLPFYKALFQARCGLAAAAGATLPDVARFGDGFLPVRDFGFDPVWEDEGFQTARERMAAALPEVVAAEIAFEVEGRDLIPEGIAFDASSGALYIGSMNRNEILKVTPDGEQRRVADSEEGLGQVLGLAIDPGRRQLLAVDIGPLVEDPADRRTGAVVAIDLDSGEVARRLEAYGALQLNDVTAASDGTIYATDSAGGTLWHAAENASSLERWLPEVVIPGVNGLAVSADGEALYVAHSTGVARIDRGTGEVLPRIANDTRETLGAIDGLYARGRRLYGIQNVTNPGRVIAIELDETGTRAVEVTTLLSHHHPALDEPTTGTVAGDRLLVLANSHVARLEPDGSLRDEATIRAPVILSVPLP